MSAGRQIKQASKQTIKMNNAEVTPQRACHRPIPTIYGLWPVKGATCGQLPIKSRDMLHTVFPFLSRIISRQRRPWGEKTTGKRAEIDDSGDPLWASLIQNRVRDNTNKRRSSQDYCTASCWTPCDRTHFQNVCNLVRVIACSEENREAWLVLSSGM